MKNNLKIELAISLALIVFTILLLNPFHFLMPTMMHTLVLTFTLATFAFFANFLIREKVEDEREIGHRMLSGRVAFLTGSALLTIGSILQSLRGEVDVWLVIVLVAMVISKILTRVYCYKCL